MLGGVVISQTKTTAVHAMGYSLTYFKGIDHGRANGLLLGEFMEYTEKFAPEKIHDILDCMGMKTVDEFKAELHKILGETENFVLAELECMRILPTWQEA